MIDLMFGTRPDPSTEAKHWLAAPLEEAVAKGDDTLAQRLVQAGAYINGGVMCRAVQRPNVALVEYMLDHGARINQCWSGGRSPLHVAASCSKVEMVRLLLLKGADINSRGGTSFTPPGTPLVAAVEAGKLAVVEFLLMNGADPTIRFSEEHISALDVAARVGRVDVMRMLLAHGADVNFAPASGPGRGRTALHGAVESNNVGVIDVLVEAGADVQAGGETYYSPLHIAAKVNPAATLALLNHGAEVNARTPCYRGWTPLHFAAKEAGEPGFDEVVDLLLRWGADETILSTDGRTAAGTVTQYSRSRMRGHAGRVTSLLARAPADRAWRRRGWMVLCRAHPDRTRLDGDLARLVAKVLRLEEDDVFRMIVGYL